MSNKVKGLWLYKKYKRSIMKHLEPIFGMEILQSRMQKLEPVVLQQLAYSKWLLYLPKVIICKKPYSAVDVHMRQVTEELIRTYTAKGIAVIILTSNTNEAYAMGGRIVQLNNIQRIPPQHER
jgi:ABC-type sugar transport system ATPase subunit